MLQLHRLLHLMVTLTELHLHKMAIPFEHTLKSGNRRLGLNEYTSTETFSPKGMPGLMAWVHPESGFYLWAVRKPTCFSGWDE